MRNWKRSSISVSHGDILPASVLAISLPEIIDRASAYNTGILIGNNNSLDTSFYSYKNLLTDAAIILGGLRSFGLQPQDKIILQLQDTRYFFAALWGCFLGGFVPIPLEVAVNSAQGNNKLQTVWELCNSPLVIAETPLEEFKTATIAELLDNQPDRNYHYPNSNELALLLFTSGSTGKPKGVMLSVKNLLVGVYGMAKVNQLTQKDITLNWMPLEHVASLVMFHLTEIYLGCQQIHVSTSTILQNPLQWLNLIDKYRVTATWSPNFAYNLVNQKLKDNLSQQWDLSCVRWMGNGAEAVVAQTTKKFLQSLAPYGLKSNVVSPGYGMSETCSGIAHSDSFNLNTESDFVEVGAPIPGVSLRIVDENNEVATEGEIGLLQVKGETVTQGYYKQPELNKEVFTDDGWFNTGDLGFLKDGKLTITGRQKDVIIINGVNYYNHDIERVVEEIPKVTASYTAACGVRENNSQEQIAIFFHTEEQEKLRELIKEIRSRVFKDIGVAPTYIIPVTQETIPKTAIGKIQRQQLSKRFAAGEFNNSIAEVKQLIETRNLNPQELPQNEIEKRLVAVWQEVLNLTTVGINDNFFELGGNSLLLMEVLGKLASQYSLSAVTLFQYPTINALAHHLRNDSKSEAIETGIKRGKRRQAYQDVAIIGMSCRFPGAANISQFWENLCNGVESISWFSDRDILNSGVDAELLSNPDYVKASLILDNIEYFDAEFWGYSPKEAQLLDPQQRLFLECAWESLEDAGYDPFTYEGEIGLYGGAAANTYLLNHIYPNRDSIDDRDTLQTLNLSSLGGFQVTVANDKDYITTRTSYKLNLTGSSVNVQTACSTSLVTVHLACQSLINSECDMALAGGVSVHTPQKMGYLYQEGMILSPDGHCKAFDADAGGTIFGSGAGMVVLKLLDRAIEEGDRIYGIIKGCAVNNDGGTKVGYLAPNVEGQARVVAEALTVADISPHTIGYIEAHGTGTKLGDPIEIAALTQAFQGVESQNIANNSCAVGSVKTNVGHLQIASGIVGLIKTTLCLYHQKIPPSLHFKKPNPQIDFDNSPFYINTELKDWKSNGYPRRAGVNSLGIGGTNAHLILEESVGVIHELPLQKSGVRTKKKNKTESAYLFTISAKSETALQELAKVYQKYIDKHPNTELKDICFTTNKGRHHFNYRKAIVARNKAELKEKLAENFTTLPIVENNKIAFLFTGQGSQYWGMAQQLYNVEQVFRENIDKCAKILKTENIAILEAFYQTANFDINQTQYTQPLLFAIEYSLAQMWLSWNIKPDVVIGHSLGEYVAATIAGIFSLEDALLLVTKRAKLMQKLPQNGAMLAVFANKKKVTNILSDEVVIAADNGSHVVVSGMHNTVINIANKLDYLGIKHQCLKVSHGFHSPLMQPIIKEFKAVAETINYAFPKIPLVSNITGQLADETITTPEYWTNHILQPVEFAKGIEFLDRQSVNIFLEIGTKPTLTTIVDSLLENKLCLHSLNPNTSDWQQILNTLGQLYTKGININWKAVTQNYSGKIVSLPHYPFQRKRYWFELPENIERKQIINNKNKIHPLLEHKITTPLKQTIFQSFLNSNTIPWLKDHCINNKIVFPGTAYLEIAITPCLGFAEIASAVHSLKTESITIANVTFNTSFDIDNLDAIPEIQLILTPEETSKKWEIYSSNKEEWQLHSCGEILPLVTPVSKSNLKSLQQQFQDLEISVDSYYKQCQERNINYGESFQGIKQLYAKNNEALGFIELPKKVNATQYYFHPALLDACLHILFAALPEELQTITYIPVALEKLEIYELPNNKVWSYLKIREDNKQHQTVIADVLLYGDSGNVIAKITGLKSQCINNEPVWHDWLYKQQWIPQPLSAKYALNSKTGTWLIFADATGMAQNLAFILDEQKEAYFIVIRDNISEKDTKAWQSLIQQHNDIKGILYLWSLDSKDAMISCQNYLYLLQTLVKQELPNNPPLWFVTRNAQPVINYQLTSGINQSCLWGMEKAIALEHPELLCVGIDLAPHPTAKDAANIWQEICSLETEKVSYRDNKRYVARLVKTSLNLFNSTTNNKQLQIINPGNLDSLQWQKVTRLQPQKNEIEIEVKATGLNFRDVTIALDLYPDDSLFLGLECAGIITKIGNKVTDFKVGDSVIAIAKNSFSQYLTVNSSLAIKKPDSLTFTEAATITVTFLTAHYTLIHLAQLQPGEKVLIHAAAGGVGLAAIAVARQRGAEIFATASPSKWELLRSLGVTNIMNSRSLDFADDIMTLTEGKGVDVVLNSLSGEFIPKSISVLKERGRFLEIGKQGIWQKEDVAKLNPSINYFIIDLWRITQDNPQLIQEMLSKLIPQFATGKLQPLPQTLFISEQIRDAFRYMQQGKHTGKIVITQPETSNITNTPSFQGTYLITGGMGAIGLKVAQWLSKKGVKHLVLVGRNGVKPELQPILEKLAQDTHVETIKADIVDPNQVERVFKQIESNLPPLKGIIHCAGVTSDRALQHQDTESLSKVLAPKVQGAWNLHHLSQKYDIESFILFSSASSLIGAAGQANYCAANAFLDTLAQARRTQGLPAISINWGAWQNTGIANLQIEHSLKTKGIDVIPSDEAIEILEQIIINNPVQIGVIPINWQQWELHNKVTPFYSDLISLDIPEATNNLLQQLTKTNAEQRLSIAIQQLIKEVANILGIKDTDEIDIDAGFSELGLDSLSSVELKNKIKSSYDLKLETTAIFDYPTIKELAEYILSLLFKTESKPENITNENLNQIANLSEAEAEALLLQELENLDNI